MSGLVADTAFSLHLVSLGGEVFELGLKKRETESKIMKDRKMPLRPNGSNTEHVP